MLKLNLRLLDEATDGATKTISRSGVPSKDWAKEAHRFYVRLAEVRPVLSHVRFMLKLCSTREADSDWHNHNYCVLEMNEKVSEVFEAFASLIEAICTAPPQSGSVVAKLSTDGGNWYFRAVEPYSEWVKERLNRREVSRFFRDHEIRFDDLIMDNFQFNENGSFGGLKMEIVDFKDPDAVRSYKNEIETAENRLFRKFQEMRSLIMDMCTSDELL